MKFYVTTPIYYVNDRPHIGHVYTTTIADIAARFHRLCGDEVFFLTGTDEHAAKVVDSAAEHGVTAQQWADQNAKAFQDTFAKLGIRNDDFIRTSQERHKVKVQQYVGELLETGDVYLGDYEGWYDAGQEEYLPENKAKEYEFKSPINGKPLVRKKEKNYFFRLSKYSDALLKLLEERPEFVHPDVRRNEVRNRIREGLNDVPISRAGASEWGIRVPGDAQHTIYVWIDALFNYLSTVDTRRSSEVLAGGRAFDREGHPLVPRRDLARDAHGIETRVAAAGVRAQLLDQRRPEDEQEPRQLYRHRENRPVCGELRARRAAVFFGAPWSVGDQR